MTEFGKRIAARIARLGPITLAEYMAEVLTRPDGGYYMAGDPFGAAGDFVTAPEISQMFGELIGLWCAETWRRLGAPDPVLLVELGPGRGTLMADALRAGRAVPGFAAALRLHLVEASPALEARQRAALARYAAQLGGAPRWHANLGDLPEGPMLLIANEFFDALPVRQFERCADGWCERRVGLAEDGATLVLTPGPPSRAATRLLPASLCDAPVGSIVEISSAAAGTAAEIGRRLAAGGGAALIVDYGHDRPRCGATLQALRRHARHDILAAPGRVDLTAHVDFSALVEAARAAGAAAYGPLSQGRFLAALGIGARAAALRAGANVRQAGDIDAALARLTDPEGMGELFRVLALTGPGLGAPAGFAPDPA
jgi:NADH dehydrogenase [ubiquinone] 1 alpha subcomplex assembly factor 7